ncbi:MAG: hypothetical protein IJR70_04805 [Eubacterium sp.]|nr:hypothetical protein [Eubacterium sp.]
MSYSNFNNISMKVVRRDWAPQHNGGPLVKSGPTYGRVRSTRKDGRWRAKRSDAGTKRNSFFNVF